MSPVPILTDLLVCATLLKHLDIIDDYLFAHPKDLQDGKVEVTKKDVLANVPYVEGCGPLVRPPHERIRTARRHRVRGQEQTPAQLRKGHL